MNLGVTLCTVLIAGAWCGEAHASRKFTQEQYLRYRPLCPTRPCNPIVEGLSEFGLAAWIRINDTEGVQEIVNNQRPGQGFSLRLDGTSPEVLELEFTYANFPHTVSVSAVVNTYVGEWVHVAAELELFTGMPMKAYLFIDGFLAGSSQGGTAAPMTGSNDIYIGAVPGVSGPTNGFGGDVHDVCIINRGWGILELAEMQWTSAKDVIPSENLLFNPRLRKSAADPISGIVPALVPTGATLLQGMGPNILYGDQKSTVIVIGDTQILAQNDVNQGTQYMAQLGDFVLNYRDTLDIRAIFHCGDWVNVGRNSAQLAKARGLADRFNDTGQAWACTMGNHDYYTPPGSNPANPQTRDIHLWAQNQHMPGSLFQNQPWHVAFMGEEFPCLPHGPPLQADTQYVHAFEFTLADSNGVQRPQLGIVSPYGITPDAIEWAHCQAEAFETENPQGKVWFVSHFFTYSWGGIASGTVFPNDPFPGLAASAAWDSASLVSLNEISNLGFVFCGHDFDGNAYTANQHTPILCNVGCRPVHMLIVNGQGVTENSRNCVPPGQASPGGGGFMQILTCTLADNGALDIVEVESYVPLLDIFFVGDPAPCQSYDSESYTFEVDFDYCDHLPGCQ